MTDRQPYITALMDKCPGGGWTACGLSRDHIRSLTFEEVSIRLGHDLCPCLTIRRRYTYMLPLDPEALAEAVHVALQTQADESERAAKMLRRMCFPMGG